MFSIGNPNESRHRPHSPRYRRGVRRLHVHQQQNNTEQSSVGSVGESAVCSVCGGASVWALMVGTVVLKFEFKPEYFARARCKRPGEKYWQWASDVANAGLQEMLKEAPAVYGNIEVGTWSEERRMSAFHTAKLVDIEELK